MLNEFVNNTNTYQSTALEMVLNVLQFQVFCHKKNPSKLLKVFISGLIYNQLIWFSKHILTKSSADFCNTNVTALKVDRKLNISYNNWQDTTIEFGPHAADRYEPIYAQNHTTITEREKKKPSQTHTTQASIISFVVTIPAAPNQTVCLRECESNRTIVSVELLQIGKNRAVECEKETKK